MNQRVLSYLNSIFNSFCHLHFRTAAKKVTSSYLGEEGNLRFHAVWGIISETELHNKYGELLHIYQVFLFVL
jgi:hypothetical protein